MITEFRGKFAFFSNFIPVKIEHNGHTYNSVEHAYCSEKDPKNEELQELCKSDIPAGKLKKIAQKITLREDWDSVKLVIMEKLLRQKFSKQPFKNALIMTGNQNIQEGNWWGDVFWGVDLNQDPNVGENHLGRMLMHIRKDLQHIDALENCTI